MDRALIVSSTEKSTAYFTEILNAASYNHIVALQTCGEARRLVLELMFDLVIINTPLDDESGESFSRCIAVKGVSQVILVVKYAQTENRGYTHNRPGEMYFNFLS